MTNFVHTLETYHEGKRSLDELLRDVDRILDEGKDSVTSMLSALRTQNTRHPLPPAAFNAVKQLLESATETVEKQLSKIDAVDDDTEVLSNASTEDSTKEFSEAPTRVNRVVNPVKHREPPNHVFSAASQSTAIDSSGKNKASTSPPRYIHINKEGEILNGRFELKQRIGSSTVYRVYKAIDLRKMEAVARDPYVAVKILRHRFSAHPAWLIALQRQVQKCQHLVHPNIGRVYDINRDGPTTYITEEYLYGHTLAEKLRSDNFEGIAPQQARPLINAMAKALSFAHELGITHSDFKPSKVFITDTGDIKVIDFFIPSAYGELHAHAAETSSGSVSAQREESAYASPEMLEHLKPDPRDHVFALAYTAYELISGQRPFSGRGALEARDKHIALFRLAGLKAKEWGAIRKALVLERNKRTPTVERFLEEFNTKERTAFQGLPLIAALFAGAAGVLAFGMNYFFSQLYTPSFSDLAKPKTPPPAEPKREQLATFQHAQLVKLPESSVQLLDTAPKLFAYAQLFPDKPNAALANTPDLNALTNREMTVINALHTDGVVNEQRQKVEVPSPKVSPQSAGQSHQPKPSSTGQSRQESLAKQQGASTQTQLDERITELLDRADRQIAANKLTTPESDSALQSYRQILALVPEQEGALSGLKHMEALYRKWAAAALENGELSTAQVYLSRAITLAPESPLLQEIKGRGHQSNTSSQLSPTLKTAAPHEQMQIELLTKAQRQLAVYQLTLPEGDNVSETFNQILQIDPTNRWALSGLIDIANQFETRARTLKQQGNLQQSLVIVEDGLKVLPHHQGLRTLKDELVRQTAHAAPQITHATEQLTRPTGLHKQDMPPPSQTFLQSTPIEEKPLNPTPKEEKPLDATPMEEKPSGEDGKRRKIKTYVTF